MKKKDIERSFEVNKARFLREWKELLGFESISTDRAREGDCIACANWLVKHLRGVGFHARLLKTPSKPVVYAERKGNAKKPTVLFYGHYDVQPVDPLDEWKSPPFEPALRRGRLYARGAQDNKGQLFYAVKAMETLIRHNALDSTVKIVLEGEEESGSGGINAALSGWKDLLNADVLMVTDTNMVGTGAPTIVMGLRGIIHLTAELTGPLYDLHSGTHGGVAPNPAMEMARLISTLHKSDGSVAVKGFYDVVKGPTEKERRLANEARISSSKYRMETGVPPVAGERCFGPAERAGFRPTVEVNGIHSGYGGHGSKTIIPARAMAKLSARLVPGQKPDTCIDLIVRHLKRHAPKGLQLSITEKGSAGPALRLNPDSPLVGKAKGVLDQLSDKKTAFQWEGASIPVIASLAHVSGAEPLLVGFGSEADKAHAPNESFSIEQFKNGYMYVAMMLREVGD